MTDPANEEALEEALKRLERETAGPLGTWADARRAEVEAVTRETGPADRALAVHTFEQLAGRRLRPRWGPGLVAAALLAGVALGFFGRDLFMRRAPEERVLLGPGTIAPIRPGPITDGYDLFAWSAGGEQGKRYGLRVWNAGELEPAFSVDGLERPQYAPSPEELARLGPAIRWEVVLQDEDRRSLGTLLSASSSRSP